MSLNNNEQAMLAKIKELQAKEDGGQDVSNERFRAILDFAVQDTMTPEGMMRMAKKVNGHSMNTPGQQYMNVQASAHEEQQVIKNLQSFWRNEEV